jgi:predicted ATP-dependent serine protease
MSQCICSSCGASTFNEAGKCVYCGTQRRPTASVRFISVEEKREALKAQMESPEFKKRQLLREIAFLESQFKDTPNPSILIKIQNAQNKLRALT